MKNKSHAFWGVALSSVFLLSACSHQTAKPVVSPPAVISQPFVPRTVVKQPILVPPAAVAQPPKAVRVQPVPYRDLVVAPVQLQPVPTLVVPSAPVIKPVPVPVATPVVPTVKAKGAYHGSVPIDDTLRQQYQQ